MKKCPYCAEEIQDGAIKCKHCGEFLTKNKQDKWYFRTHFSVIAFLCAGPLMLPLVWFNPGLSQKKKIIITLVIVILSYYLGVLFANSIKSISIYYKQAFSSF